MNIYNNLLGGGSLFSGFKKFLLRQYNRALKANICKNSVRNIILLGDHFIESRAIPQDNYYLFCYIMERNDRQYEPYYVMNEHCPIYDYAKSKYGMHVIGYHKNNIIFKIRMLVLLKKVKVICDSYQVFHHVIPSISAAAKHSRYLYTIFTQHGITFFKSNFININSFSAFKFDKVVVSNDIEKRIFLSRGAYQPNNIIQNGLCRWDNVQAVYQNRTVFVFFTHRRYLSSKQNIKGSMYYRTIVDLLSALQLDPVLQERGFTVKVALHHSVVEKLGYGLFDNINIVKDEDIEKVKCSSDILITDYSSMCFEFWLQRKPTLFLNIHDEEDCLRAGNQTDLISPYRKKEDLIINICDTVQECIHRLNEYIVNDFLFSAQEEKIRSKFFYYDSGFRERFYNYLISIKKDEKPIGCLPLNKWIRFDNYAEIYEDSLAFPDKKGGRWTEKKTTSLAFYLDGDASDLAIRIKCFGNILVKQPKIAICILANGTKVVNMYEFTSRQSVILEFSVPQSCLGQENFLALEIILHDGQPQKKLYPNCADPRYLGINLQAIYVGTDRQPDNNDMDSQAPASEIENVFSAIYDETAQNAISKMGEYGVSKEAYMYAALHINKGCVDILELSKITDNYTFFQAAYLMLLRRYPDEAALKGIQPMLILPTDQFQGSLVKKIIRSKEFNRSGIILKNNIYRDSKVVRITTQTKTSAVKAFLVRVAKLQPEGIKRIEKKLLRKMGIGW